MTNFRRQGRRTERDSWIAARRIGVDVWGSRELCERMGGGEGDGRARVVDSGEVGVDSMCVSSTLYLWVGWLVGWVGWSGAELDYGLE